MALFFGIAAFGLGPVAWIMRNPGVRRTAGDCFYLVVNAFEVQLRWPHAILYVCFGWPFSDMPQIKALRARLCPNALQGCCHRATVSAEDRAPGPLRNND